MISEAETLKSKEYVKRKILRLHQVREQSKELAKKIRNRVKDERGKALSELNKEKGKELHKIKQKNIEHLKSQLEDRLSQVGASHSAAVFEDLLQKEWEVTKKINRNKAIERGNKAAETLQRDRSKENKGKGRTGEKLSKSPHRTQQAESKLEEELIEPNVELQSKQIANNATDIFNVGSTADNKEKKTSRDGGELVNERGDGNYNRSNVITANYFETSPNEECNDALRKFHPTETIRQLHLSEQPTTSYSRDKLSSQRSNVVDQDLYSEVREPLNLHAMSRNNPFSTAISDHIKSRRFQPKQCPTVIEERSTESPSEMSELRDIIQHTRHALPVAPTIPKLPTGYKKIDEDTSQRPVSAAYKKSDLVPATNNWLSQSPSKDKICQSSNCKCTTCYCNVDAKSTSKPKYKTTALRRTFKSHNLRKANGSTSTTNVKYVPRRSAIRCKPSPTRSKRAMEHPDDESNIQCKYKQLPKHIRTYDECSKTERTSVPDSNYTVQRLSKGGKSAFEMARDETKETEKKASERREYYNDQARRVRGMQAAQKLQKEKEYQDIIKAIDNYEKEQKRQNKKLPDEAFMSDHRLKQKQQQQQRKMEKAYEDVERETKIHKYPGHITAPTVQPERRRSNPRNRDSELDSPSDSEEKVSKRKSPPKRRSPKEKTPVVNVASWNVLSGMNNNDDLDEIPTRDSDSTVKSIIVSKAAPKEEEVLDVQRVINLIEKQREQLLREVARMEKLNKKQVKTKSPRKKKQTVVEIQPNSTTDDTGQVFETKKSLKRRSGSPNKVKHISSAVSHVPIIKKTDSDNQQTNGSQTSISFQGFQIVVEVKKPGKSDKKETVIKSERSVQTSKSLLESQDSSTEVSIKASQVIATEKVTFENRQNKARDYTDSSASTSYMSPPDRFTRQAVQTYFGKTIMFTSSETQTDVGVQERKLYGDNRAVKKDKTRDGSNAKWVNRQRTVSRTLHSFPNSESTINIDDHTRNVDADAQKTGTGQKFCGTKEVLQTVDQNAIKSNLDPKLKGFIHQLLEISKSDLNKLEIDVSDVPTPSSSVVNVASNTAVFIKPEYSDKIQQVKHFIDENYTLLEQIQKDKGFHRNYTEKKFIEKQWSEVTSSLDSGHTSEEVAQSRNNKQTRHVEYQFEIPEPTVKQSEQNKSPSKRKKSKPRSIERHKSTSPEKSLNKNLKEDFPCEQDMGVSSDEIQTKVKLLPAKNVNFIIDNVKSSQKSPDLECGEDNVVSAKTKSREKEKSSQDVNKNIRVEFQSWEEQQEKIDHYRRLSDQCSQRIQNLSEKLEQVRKDKQITLSSNTSPSSNEGEYATQYVIQDEFVPILSNIPKPAVVRNIEFLNNSPNVWKYTQATGIQQGAPSSNIPFEPKLPGNILQSNIPPEDINLNMWEYTAQPSGIQHVPPMNLAAFEPHIPGKRPKPPAALSRHPIMRNADVIPGTPHELSTIIEVETPGPGRNASSLWKHSETSPLRMMQSKGGYVDIIVENDPINNKVNINFTNVALETEPPVDMAISPFISFQEFAKEQALEELQNILGDTTLKAINEPADTSESEDTLPDVITEMIKRGLMQNRPKLGKVSPQNASGDVSSSDSAVYVIQDSPPPIKKPARCKNNHPTSFNLSSLSGIDKLQDSTSSSGSENLMDDFEKALQSMGIHWAVSTLKKTKERMALSSTSSSADRELLKSGTKSKKEMEPEDFSNITGTSIGLSTLLKECDTPDNNLFQKYQQHLLNSSVDKKVESLLEKLSKIDKKAQSNSGKNDFKRTTPAEDKSKDRTHQKTSTPVQSRRFSSSNSASVSSQRSNSLFSNASDLSSVKNVSNSEKNASIDDKDSLNIPEMSLRFGKLFDNSNDGNCTCKDE